MLKNFEEFEKNVRVNESEIRLNEDQEASSVPPKEEEPENLEFEVRDELEAKLEELYDKVESHQDGDDTVYTHKGVEVARWFDDADFGALTGESVNCEKSDNDVSEAKKKKKKKKKASYGVSGYKPKYVMYYDPYMYGGFGLFPHRHDTGAGINITNVNTATAGGTTGTSTTTTTTSEASIQEKNWKLTIDLSSKWKDVDNLDLENISVFKKFRDDVVNLLKGSVEKVKETLDDDEAMAYEDHVNYLSGADDVEDWESLFNDLYDWADANDVWIKTVI